MGERDGLRILKEQMLDEKAESDTKNQCLQKKIDMLEAEMVRIAVECSCSGDPRATCKPFHAMLSLVCVCERERVREREGVCVRVRACARVCIVLIVFVGVFAHKKEIADHDLHPCLSLSPHPPLPPSLALSLPPALPASLSLSRRTCR